MGRTAVISQYLYISTAHSLSRAAVDDIVTTSARNNAIRGITGLLMYNGRNFLQLLEGKESELVDLMLRITHDPRHTGISLIERKTVQERVCGEWAMRRVMISESVEKRHGSLEEQLPQNLDSQIRKIVMNFAILN